MTGIHPRFNRGGPGLSLSIAQWIAHAQWRVAEADVRTAGGHPNPTVTTGPGYNFSAAAGINPLMPLPAPPEKCASPAARKNHPRAKNDHGRVTGLVHRRAGDAAVFRRRISAGFSRRPFCVQLTMAPGVAAGNAADRRKDFGGAATDSGSQKRRGTDWPRAGRRGYLGTAPGREAC